MPPPMTHTSYRPLPVSGVAFRSELSKIQGELDAVEGVVMAVSNVNVIQGRMCRYGNATAVPKCKTGPCLSARPRERVVHAQQYAHAFACDNLASHLRDNEFPPCFDLHLSGGNQL